MNAGAIRAQGSILLALMLHEASTRYGGKRLGYLWALVEPLIHITLLVMFRSAIGGRVPVGSSMFVFVATGLLPFFVFRNTMRQVASSLRSNDALLTYPVVKPTDVVLGRGLLAGATILMITGIVFLSLEFLGQEAIPDQLLVCLAALSALFSLGVSVGLLLSLSIAFFPSMRQVTTALMRTLYWISGVFYLPSSLPPRILEYLAWNPVLQCIEWFRVGFYSGYVSYVLSIEYVILWSLGFVIFSFSAERVLRRKISTL